MARTRNGALGVDRLPRMKGMKMTRLGHEPFFANVSSQFKEMADIDAAIAILDRFCYLKWKSKTYAALCELNSMPQSTIWQRDHGRILIK